MEKGPSVSKSWTMSAAACVAVACCLLAGCGPTVRMHPVKGTVRFAGGEPLSKGKVVVDSPDGKRSSWGALRADGSFVMGTLTSSDGLPAGTYQVYFHDVMTEPPVDESSAPGGMAGSKPTVAFVPKPLVHAKFLKKETAGISFEVPKQLDWEITVEPPK